MATELFNIVEGWTYKIGPFTIYFNGLPLDLSGLTVTPILHRGSGAVVIPGGIVEVLNQTLNKGKLNYTPVAGDFTWEPTLFCVSQAYLLHWKLVDGTGKVAYSPSRAPAIVMVHRA